jgi:hypothetical protein
MNQREVDDKLEELVDKKTLMYVVEELGNVCHAKADHIQENWQDMQTARVWRRAAKLLDSLGAKIRREMGI